MKKQVKHFSVAQCAKVIAVMYFVISLPIVIVFLLPAFIGIPGYPVLAVVLFPFGYAVISFLGVLLAAWVYNIVAAHVGGLEFTTAEVTK